MTNSQMIDNFVKKLIVRIEWRMESFGDTYEKAKSMVTLESVAGEKCWAIVDAQETEAPWERWEYLSVETRWETCDAPVSFYVQLQYRRKVASEPETCPTCGSYCNERDELDKCEREIARLTSELAASYDKGFAACKAQILAKLNAPWPEPAPRR